MRTLSHFTIIALFLFSSIYSSAQDASSGIAEIDQQAHDLGLSILKSTSLKLSPQEEKTMSITCYGGNLYIIGSFYNWDDLEYPLTIEVINEQGVVSSTGSQEAWLDFRYMHGAFSVTLSLKNPNSKPISDLLILQTYKSVTNITSDHSANLSEKSYYTLDGVTVIQNERQKITSQLEDYLSAELTKQGYSVSASKALGYDGKNTVWPYTFYRENDYVIFAMGTEGNPVSFQLIEPATTKENPFGGEPLKREEQLIQESAEGTVGVSFRDKNPNLWKWAIRPNYQQLNYGSLSMFIIGYKSADNTSMQAVNNKPEKFYVR